MSTDVRDAALQAICPCVPVPRYGRVAPLQEGQRVLVARNGLFMEFRSPWLECVVKLAALPETPPMPYGEVSERTAFAFGVIPVALLEAFIEQGRMALPNEIAGALVFNRCSGALRLQMHEAISAGPGSIRYRLPTLQADESLAVDLHTHGRLHAFWSATDDADDQGVKVCGVFGDLHRNVPSAAFRLALNGHYRPLSHPWEASRVPSTALDTCVACPTLDAMGFMEGHPIWST